MEFAKTTLPDPLPAAFTTSGPPSSMFLTDLTGAQATDVIATQITVDAGSAPPTGGGIEVRQSDGRWGPTSDGNLVGRYTNRRFGLPRLSRIQEYPLRRYDGSTPPKYSRRSAFSARGLSVLTLTNSEKENPRGLKPARNDKNKSLVRRS